MYIVIARCMYVCMYICMSGCMDVDCQMDYMVINNYSNYCCYFSIIVNLCKHLGI